MSQAAEGRMLIDQETYDLVNDKIMSEQEKFYIPGMGEIDAYRVIRLARMSKRPT